MKRLHAIDDYVSSWIIFISKRIIFIRHKSYRYQITIFSWHCYLIHSSGDYFPSNSRSKIRIYVQHTHPSKMKILACNKIYGCHLYTLNLLLAQSYIPLLLHKYGFISCYFNLLLLHKILMLEVFQNVCVNFNSLHWF